MFVTVCNIKRGHGVEFFLHFETFKISDPRCPTRIVINYSKGEDIKEVHSLPAGVQAGQRQSMFPRSASSCPHCGYSKHTCSGLDHPNNPTSYHLYLRTVCSQYCCITVVKCQQNNLRGEGLISDPCFTGLSPQLGFMALCTWAGHHGGGNMGPRQFSMDREQRNGEGKYPSGFLVTLLPLVLSGPLASGTKGSISNGGFQTQPLMHLANFLGDSESNQVVSDDEPTHHILTGSS